MGQAGVLEPGGQPCCLRPGRRTQDGKWRKDRRGPQRRKDPCEGDGQRGRRKTRAFRLFGGSVPCTKTKRNETKQNVVKKKKGRVACLWTPALCVRRTSSSSPLFGPQRPRWGERLVTRNLCGNPGASRSRFLKSFPQTWRHATQEPRAPPCAGHEPDSGDVER